MGRGRSRAQTHAAAREPFSFVRFNPFLQYLWEDNTPFSPENVKAMSGDIRLAALQVIDQFVNHVQAGADKSINILDWTSKATCVTCDVYGILC